MRNSYFYRDGFLFSRVIGEVKRYLEQGNVVNSEAAKIFSESSELILNAVQLTEFFAGGKIEGLVVTSGMLDSTERIRNFFFATAKERGIQTDEPFYNLLQEFKDHAATLRELALGTQPTKERAETTVKFLEGYVDNHLFSRVR